MPKPTIEVECPCCGQKSITVTINPGYGERRTPPYEPAEPPTVSEYDADCNCENYLCDIFAGADSDDEDGGTIVWLGEEVLGKYRNTIHERALSTYSGDDR